jgi:hypothetical protein
LAEYFLVPFDDAPPAAPVDGFRLNWRTHQLDADENQGRSAGSPAGAQAHKKRKK